MSMLHTAGRYLFALPMAVFGLMHMMNGPAMTGMVPIPGGIFWVYLTGVALIAAAAAIAVGKMGSLAAALLGIMLMIFALSIHLPGVMGAADEMAMQASMSNMLKDLALAGGAFVISGALARSEAGASDA